MVIFDASTEEIINQKEKQKIQKQIKMKTQKKFKNSSTFRKRVKAPY